MATIGYRRMSGAIGISLAEKGTRGLWWEKRLALTNWLHACGHSIFWLSRMTKASQDTGVSVPPPAHVDVLMVEFGSSNTQFNGKDLEETHAIVMRHKGPIVFICDDPDLPYLWKTVPAARAKQWRCWYNAAAPAPFGGQPTGIPVFDFPFSSLQAPASVSLGYQCNHLAYIGRPGGREKQVRALIAGRVPFRAYAKPAEWEKLGVLALPPPNQPDRAAFYASQLGCLVLADAKHKRLGWRTGRAFHSILAGCPAVVEADHVHLAKNFPSFKKASDLVKLAHDWALSPSVRNGALVRPLEKLKEDRRLCEQAVAELEL